jgi:hypothetical protein
MSETGTGLRMDSFVLSGRRAGKVAKAARGSKSDVELLNFAKYE